jgi:hypothetical protein
VAGAANGVLNAALGSKAVATVPAYRAVMDGGANNTTLSRIRDRYHRRRGDRHRRRRPPTARPAVVRMERRGAGDGGLSLVGARAVLLGGDRA